MINQLTMVSETWLYSILSTVDYTFQLVSGLQPSRLLREIFKLRERTTLSAT